MVNEIVDGVSAAMGTAFEGIDIYDENITQGLYEPCFFIAVVSPSETPELGNRYRRQTLLDIHYFPKAGNAEARTVGESLFGVLEYIELPDGPVRGTGMRYEIIDGVLHFFVSYNMSVIKPKTPALKMGGVTVINKLEG